MPNYPYFILVTGMQHPETWSTFPCNGSAATPLWPAQRSLQRGHPATQRAKAHAPHGFD
jgi:hypothetical protein